MITPKLKTFVKSVESAAEEDELTGVHKLVIKDSARLPASATHVGHLLDLLMGAVMEHSAFMPSLHIMLGEEFHAAMTRKLSTMTHPLGRPSGPVVELQFQVEDGLVEPHPPPPSVAEQLGLASCVDECSTCATRGCRHCGSCVLGCANADEGDAAGGFTLCLV